MSQAHRYSIRVADAAAHLYEVTLTVAEPDADGQVVRMPAWIPGSYMVRDYARNVVSIRAESDGLAVPLDKTDKSTWRARPTARPLKITAEIFAYDQSVRGAHLDLTHAYFNGPCVFLEAVGQEDRTCKLEIVEPEAPVGKGWRVATSMRRKGAAEYGFGLYEADDYAELIDHPVEIGELLIGEFEALGIPHAIAIRGRTRTDMARLCRDLKTICEHHLNFLGAPEHFDRYLFLLYAPGEGYGGLEHRWSSSLVCARDSLPAKADEEISDGYRTLLKLVSHEYFHLWNVKRMKPAAFTPYDLREESYTNLLWVFEGITSYYDELGLLRSGLVPEARYLDALGRTITRVLRGSGRARQSVAESSFDAWTKFYKQDANAQNAIVSYYAKGALIALSLDLKLRSETGCRVTLDDVVRECWNRYGETGTGMPEDGFETVCKEVSELDLDDFFDATVRGTGELPLESLLATHGVEMHLRAAAGRADLGGKPATPGSQPAVAFGATLRANNGRLEVTSVANGSAAEIAGVAPGDVAIALDGLALTEFNVEARLKRIRPNDRLDLVVFRGDELLTLPVRFKAAPEDTCYLVLTADVDTDVEALRAAWLS
ncbi:MAG: PDZ domain-containing protein [Pseudomonadota bacterium]